MMRKSARALRAVVLSIALTAVACGSATAAHGALEPAGQATFTSSGAIAFDGSFVSISCDMTLSASLATGLMDLAGEPAGTVDDVDWSECSGGSISAASNLPWTMAVTGTSGTLPDAATALGLDVQGVALSFTTGFLTCQYAGDLPAVAALTGPRPYTVGSVAAEGTFARVSGGLLCPATGTAAGTFDLGPAQTLAVDEFTVSREVRFRETTVGESSRASIHLQNGTEERVTIDRVEVVGSEAFTAPSGGIALDQGQANFGVTFSPTRAGAHTAEVRFYQGDRVIRTSNVSGSARAR